MTYKQIQNLQTLLPDIPTDSIISRKVYSDEQTKVTLFGFAPDQELTEHTAAYPAILHFLSGEAVVTCGDDMMTAEAGTWLHMPAHLPHSIEAQTAVTMLLYLLV